jgi:hypothetical protein
VPCNWIVEMYDLVFTDLFNKECCHLWDIGPCSPYVNRRFERMYHHYLQGPTPENRGGKFLRNVESHMDYTMLHAKGGNIHNYRCENLKYHITKRVWTLNLKEACELDMTIRTREVAGGNQIILTKVFVVILHVLRQNSGESNFPLAYLWRIFRRYIFWVSDSVLKQTTIFYISIQGV